MHTDTQSHDDEISTGGYKPGLTGFLTKRGFDLLLRNERGETKGRLRKRLPKRAGKRVLSGDIPEPGNEGEKLAFVAVFVSKDEVHLTLEERTWKLLRPKGKKHFFAFLNQWPSKAEAVDSIDEMFAALDAEDDDEASE